ncbi:DUF3142 domain-containing protein [Dokdonella soli]
MLPIVAAAGAPAATTHEVYVWQRQWTPALHSALEQSRDLFTGARVLVAQAGRDGRWLATEATPQEFSGDTRPIVAVVRYDGAGTPPDVTALMPFLDRLFAHWRSAGVAIAGVEIDYDCASARLADYAARLHDVRARLPSDVRLSITALPAWLGAPALDGVLDASDEAVLQVHAVEDPARGLFDAQRAERWIRSFAPHARQGFRVALPAYGSRVRFGGDGRAVAVESEMPVDRAATDSARELRVDPAEVVQLLGRLAAEPPRNWNGVVWFRLPLAGDRRAWTLAALRDVVAGRVPMPRVSATMAARDNAASDIFVSNVGAADATVGGVLVSGSECTAGDALPGWRGERVAQGWRFEPEAPQPLRAGTRRAVGWVRCAQVDGARLERNGIEGRSDETTLSDETTP